MAGGTNQFARPLLQQQLRQAASDLDGIRRFAFNPASQTNSALSA